MQFPSFRGLPSTTSAVNLQAAKSTTSTISTTTATSATASPNNDTSGSAGVAAGRTPASSSAVSSSSSSGSGAGALSSSLAAGPQQSVSVGAAGAGGAAAGGGRRRVAEDADAAAAEAVRRAEAAGLLQGSPADRTLRFQVCNGFTNQRLSIVYGALLAVKLQRSLVLPVLIDNGLQRTDNAVLASTSNQVAFSGVYDQPYFIQSMADVGLRVLRREEAPPVSSYTRATLAEYGWSVAAPLAEHFAAVPHLSVDCPLFKVAAGDLVPSDWDLLWAVLEALRPNPQAAELVEQVVANILRHSGAGSSSSGIGSSGGSGSEAAAEGSAGSGASAAGSGGEAPAQAGGADNFNFMHLRIESDWLAHCSRWESINDGLVRDNCYSHTDEIGERLALFGLSNSTILYVGSYWPDVRKERSDKAFAQLMAAGFRVVTSADVFPRDRDGEGDGKGEAAEGAGGGDEPAAAAAARADGQPQQGQNLPRRRLARQGLGWSASRGREYNAMIEYFVGMRANRFIGNSVSTFAALGLLERRHRGYWAAYYNGGNIPLASLLPGLHRLPWVFTYNSWSPDYEYMLKGAVRSGLSTRSLHPYCIFQGNMSSPIATWLAAQGVHLIRHTPEWTEALLERARTRAKDNVHHSHLFKTPDMLVSTFQRVDLPVVPVLDQYTYVLYTDADVYFRRPIRLDDFGLPLPHSVSMSYEFVDMFPYNAGVIVANLPTMRINYKAFIRMMLENDNGLYYTNYGPADQGIMNKFYEADLRARMLHQAFNSKTYNAFDPSAFIVHFHGPKPHELLDFLTSGKCDFFTVCESSFLNGLCTYTSEWVQWVYDDLGALRLEDACAWMGNPAVAQLFKQKWGLQGDLPAAGTGAGGVAGAEHSVPEAHRAEFVQADDLRALDRAAASDTSHASPASASARATDSASDDGSHALNQDQRLQQQQQLPGEGGGIHTERMQRALLSYVERREGREREQAEAAQRAAAQRRRSRLGHRSGAAEGAGGDPHPGLDQDKQLMDFDRFQAVTVDEAALEAAWDNPAASTADEDADAAGAAGGAPAGAGSGGGGGARGV